MAVTQYVSLDLSTGPVVSTLFPHSSHPKVTNCCSFVFLLLLFKGLIPSIESHGSIKRQHIVLLLLNWLLCVSSSECRTR